MPVTESGSITAVLKLETTNFTEGLTTANKTITKFENAVMKAGKNAVVMENGINAINTGITTLIPTLNTFNKLTSNVSNFNKFANGVSKISTGLVQLSSDSINAEQGITILNNIMNTWKSTLEGTTVQVRGLSNAEKLLNNSTNQAVTRQQRLQQSLANQRNSFYASRATLNSFAQALNGENASLLTVTNSMRQYSSALTMPRQSLEVLTANLVRNSEAMQQNAVAKLRNMGYTGQLSAEEKLLSNSENQVTNSANRATQALERQNTATNQATASMGKATTQTSRLRNVLMSLRSVGMLVGSMLAYNFIHHLGQATNESINAKSEMEGYFKMLNYGQDDILRFNDALDETVNRFQRVNKYSLGETISSIGVEFDLTTEEMIKAMDVTSMITSEYLRAGRNANEASLAVKDVLQGQFQRLSRETGVGKEELTDAGWSGDPMDTNSLLDALRKVGESRHWDVFAEKANSLNDIVTILQNRFGEWSADMVNVVQPSIVNAFNSMISFAGGLSESLSSVWKWLNTGSWESTATKIGLVSGAVLTLMPMLTAYRGGTTLLKTANLSLTQSLGALIFGINAETLANQGASDALAMKLLGIQAEEVEDVGLIGAINGVILARETETVATAEAATTNIGFVGGLTAMITGEALAEGATLSLTGTLGLLTGAFLASPIGWFTLAILGLASAFYVLTGGLDDSWAKMQDFNKTMQDTDTAQKQAHEWLNQVKTDAGENSQEFKDAKDSVDEYVLSLQSASYWYNHSRTAYEGVDLTMSSSSKNVLKDYGISDEEVKTWTGNFESLSLGKNKYYTAEQVLNKQLKGENSNYAKDLKDYLADVESTGGDLESAYTNFTSNYENLAKHSYEANTAEDWWSWLWASFYAGMDQFWIDWDSFWANPQWDKAIDGMIKGLGSFNGISGLFESFGINGDSIVKGWDSFWQGVSDGIANWQNDALDLMKPVNEFGDEVNKFLDDPLGYLGITLPSDWSIWSILGFDSVSASNGSANHPSFTEDLSNIFGFDVQEWINNLSGTFDISGIVSDFTSNLGNMVSSTSTTSINIGDMFSGMKNTVNSHITSIGSKASSGFEYVKTTSISKISAMRDSVGNVIHQMTGAWTAMKNSILNSAKLIYDGVKSKFDGVKNTLSDFFTKLQNPSQWGAGQQSMSRSPRPSVARRLFSPVKSSVNLHGAGYNPYTSSPNKSMSINNLLKYINPNEEVNILDFLSLFSGGFGGWNFHEASKKKIFDVGKKWKSAPANIKGIGSVGNGYQVGRFWNGRPTFTWNEFMATAQAIFSAIPYKFYYDSEWKGNWINALLSGAVNCSDGADALIALASVFGFSGSKIHTTTKDGTGHFYARINGMNMDTTHFQNSGSWSPLGGAGSLKYSRGAGASNKTINVTVDMRNATIYGVDDLDDRIADGVDKGLAKHFDDPYTVAI